MEQNSAKSIVALNKNNNKTITNRKTSAGINNTADINYAINNSLYEFEIGNSPYSQNEIEYLQYWLKCKLESIYLPPMQKIYCKEELSFIYFFYYKLREEIYFLKLVATGKAISAESNNQLLKNLSFNLALNYTSTNKCIGLALIALHYYNKSNHQEAATRLNNLLGSDENIDELCIRLSCIINYVWRHQIIKLTPDENGTKKFSEFLIAHMLNYILTNQGKESTYFNIGLAKVKDVWKNFKAYFGNEKLYIEENRDPVFIMFKSLFEPIADSQQYIKLQIISNNNNANPWFAESLLTHIAVRSGSGDIFVKVIDHKYKKYGHIELPFSNEEIENLGFITLKEAAKKKAQIKIAQAKPPSIWDTQIPLFSLPISIAATAVATAFTINYLKKK